MLTNWDLDFFFLFLFVNKVLDNCFSFILSFIVRSEMWHRYPIKAMNNTSTSNSRSEQGCTILLLVLVMVIFRSAFRIVKSEIDTENTKVSLSIDTNRHQSGFSRNVVSHSWSSSHSAYYPTPLPTPPTTSHRGEKM